MRNTNGILDIFSDAGDFVALDCHPHSAQHFMLYYCSDRGYHPTCCISLRTSRNYHAKLTYNGGHDEFMYTLSLLFIHVRYCFCLSAIPLPTTRGQCGFFSAALQLHLFDFLFVA